MVEPGDSDTGSITIRIQNAPTVTAPITIGGAPVTVTTTVPTQQSQLTFTSSSANQVINVQRSANTYPNCEHELLSLNGPLPDTTRLDSTDVCTGTDAFTLPAIGTYTLTVIPADSDTGGVTIQIH
jgi:hypothetical protein